MTVRTILEIVRNPTATLTTMMTAMRMAVMRMKTTSKTIAIKAHSVLVSQVPTMHRVHTINIQASLIHIFIVADDAVRINISIHNNGNVVATSNMILPTLIFETRM